MKNRSQVIIIFILFLLTVGLSIICVNLYINGKILSNRTYEKQPVVYDLAFNTSRIPIKESPRVDAIDIDYLEQDTKVEVIELSNTWARIRFLNQTGYVNSKDLLIQNANKKITTVDLPFRKAPNSGEVLYVISKGSVIECIEEVGEWGKVYYNNRTGYVSNKYLIDYRYDPNITNIKQNRR